MAVYVTHATHSFNHYAFENVQHNRHEANTYRNMALSNLYHRSTLIVYLSFWLTRFLSTVYFVCLKKCDYLVTRANNWFDSVIWRAIRSNSCTWNYCADCWAGRKRDIRRMSTKVVVEVNCDLMVDWKTASRWG